MYYFCQYSSPIGMLTLASDGSSLTGLWMDGQKHFAQNHTDPVPQPALPIFRDTFNWLDRYFAGKPVSANELPLKPQGSPFQQQVWKMLIDIPYGHTQTYGQIAKALVAPHASQAVGAAVGRNPISIIIPCHRVLGTGGKLTGYAGGLHRKKWLLIHEGILTIKESHRKI